MGRHFKRDDLCKAVSLIRSYTAVSPLHGDMQIRYFIQYTYTTSGDLLAKSPMPKGRRRSAPKLKFINSPIMSAIYANCAFNIPGIKLRFVQTLICTRVGLKCAINLLWAKLKNGRLLNNNDLFELWRSKNRIYSGVYGYVCLIM